MMLIFISILEGLLRNISGAVGCRVRRWYYGKRLKSCGNNVLIEEGVYFQNPEWISVGNNVWIDKYVLLIAGPIDTRNLSVKHKVNEAFKYAEGELVIGDNIHVAPFCLIQAHFGVALGNNSGLSSGVKMYSLSNVHRDSNNKSKVVHFTPLSREAVYLAGPIVIGENVGIALNSVVLPGVVLGDNSFVAAQTVVTRSLPQNSYISADGAVERRFEL